MFMPSVLQVFIGAALVLSSSAHANGTTKAGKRTEAYPAPIAEMMKRGSGVAFQDKFDVGGGVVGYVLAASNGERRIYYVTPDKKHAILGIMFNERLENVTADHQKTYMNVLEFLGPSGSSETRHQAAAIDLARRGSHTFVEGQGREVNVVFDPLCVDCKDFYKSTRTMLDRLMIRWVPVAVNKGDSALWLEAFVVSQNRGDVLSRMFGEEKVDRPQLGVTSKSVEAHKEGMAIREGIDNKALPLLLYVDSSNTERSFAGSVSMRLLNDIANGSTRAHPGSKRAKPDSR